jgi:hypothetical protein
LSATLCGHGSQSAPDLPFFGGRKGRGRERNLGLFRPRDRPPGAISFESLTLHGVVLK